MFVYNKGKPVNTPNPGAYFRMFSEHNVTAMFVAPTALRAVRREDPEGEYVKHYKFPNFKYLFVAGEHCDHETMEWIRNIIKVPILDNWWQTETGSAITATNVGLGNDLYPPPGVAGKPVPGWNLRVIRKDTTECNNYELGQIVAKLPLPPTCLSSLWESDDRFEELYFRKYPVIIHINLLIVYIYTLTNILIFSSTCFSSLPSTSLYEYSTQK